MGADIPVSGERQTNRAAAAPADAIDWLGENVGKPLYNTAIAGTWEWVANLERLNGLTPVALQLPKLESYHLQTAQEGSLAWLAQGVASTAGAIPGYLASTYLARGMLGKASKVLQLEAPTARLMMDARTAQIGGAALLNATRDLAPGESRESALITGTANMAAFAFAGPYISRLGAWKLAAYPALGAVASPVSLALSDLATTGSTTSLSDARLWSASLNGAVFTGLLPLGQHYAGKGMDALNVAVIGRGIDLPRYIEQSGLSRSARAAANARLPLEARFELKTGLEEAAAQPEALYMRVQPVAGGKPYAGAYSRYIIPLENIERGKSQIAGANLALSAEQQAGRNDIIDKTLAAQLLAHEINSRVAAARGESPAVLGSIGFWKALHSGDITWGRMEGKKFVPMVPHPKDVGNDAVDLHLSSDGEISVPPKGQTFDLTKQTPNQIIAQHYAPKIINGKMELKPGEKFLGWTDEAIGLESGKYVGVFENVSGNARLFFSPHTDAPFIHSGETRRVVVEVINTSDNNIVLAPGQKIGQILFLCKGDPHAETLQHRSTANQNSFSGARVPQIQPSPAGTTGNTSAKSAESGGG